MTSTDVRAHPPRADSGRQGQGWHPDLVLRTVFAGAALVGLLPLWNVLRSPLPFQLPVLVAHSAGMLAGYGVVVLVGLMSRTPQLERGVGADRLARWHSAGGRSVVTLVLLHAWAATVAWAHARRLSTWSAAWDVLQMPYLVAATLGTLLFLAVAVLSVRAARKRVSYETWHAVHLLVYVAVALSFVHQLGGPDLVGHRVLQVLWSLLYTGVFWLVVEHRVVTPLRNAGRHRMRVASVQVEGPGTVSIVVEGHDLDELCAESGQFFRWRFLTPELWYTAHPFSLSAPPSRTHLRLTVKTLGDGSGRLQDLEPGTWVVAEGPYGAMTAARRTRADVLLVAGGVGITPMRALFESMPLAPGQDLLLLCFARTEQDLLFKDELDLLAACSGGRVQYLVGDAHGPLSADLLQRFVPGLEDRDVYFCGPPGMGTALRAALQRAGVPASQLHEERFAS
ncbi:MAG: ferric reductase [Frankiales bacterium]|nr:ferric reductase [Frankiales bacterium]